MNKIVGHPIKPKNLVKADFAEKCNLEIIIDDLIRSSSSDSYSASIPLLASAIIGDQARYQLACSQTIGKLDDLSAPQWMQTNAFKAWMWGRVLLASNSLSDVTTSKLALKNLHSCLNQPASPDDNSTFLIWAWGYRASFNGQEYDLSKKCMLDGALALTKKCSTSSFHEDLSNALWSWVMNLQSAANAGDLATYHWIKEQIISITQTTSVPKALEHGLLRTTQSNDFPAWALAKTRCAAIYAKDELLFRDIESPLTLSIANAKQSDNRPEYLLSVLENQLAITTAQPCL